MKGVCDGHGMYTQDIVHVRKLKHWKLCTLCEELAKENNI